MQFERGMVSRDRGKIRMLDINRERLPSSSQGKRYVVCCIMYLTRYVATEVAHHSRLEETPLIWLFEQNAKTTSVIFERHLKLGPQGN
jgi:hypothetical protein